MTDKSFIVSGSEDPNIHTPLHLILYSKLKRFLSPLRALKRHALLVRGFAYDYAQFAKWSSAVRRGDSNEKLRALITMDYHGVEKGLSLATPRLRFGMPVIARLLTNTREYIDKFGPDETTTSAIDALHEYCAFHSRNGSAMPTLQSQIEALEKRAVGEELTGGIVTVRKEDIVASGAIDLPKFYETRFSVRQFADIEVEKETIFRAVEIAQKTPSVCNRQSWRIHIVSGQSLAQKILTFHGGARGFSENVSTVLVVTTERGAFQSSGERYQCWIDGGMFSMSLVNALHHLGLGTCCLNWSKDPPIDFSFKKLLPIPPSEAVIMLIAVGHLPDDFVVARSERRPSEKIVTIHTSTATMSNIAS